MSDPRDLVWFFGYGSLMWKPGFMHAAFEPARLDGYHRALCIWSEHWRGRPGKRGLVLGLAPGGHCIGRAIGVEREAEDEAIAYLDAREMLTTFVYDRLKLPLVLLDRDRTIEAWCYVAKPDHDEFAGVLDRETLLRHVATAEGEGGTNRDYVRNTVLHLREMGISEPELEAIDARLE